MPRSPAGSPHRIPTRTRRRSISTATSRAGLRHRPLGYPANFFVVNPDVANANVTDSGAFSNYNALQLELRRRLSKGFSANVNYQYAFEGGSQFDGFSFGRAWTEVPVTGNPTVRHAIKIQWDWTLPFGRGERFGSDMHPVLERARRRLEHHRRRPHPDGPDGLRQRAAGRHVRERSAGHVQVLREAEPGDRASTKCGCCRTTSS